MAENEKMRARSVTGLVKASIGGLKHLLVWGALSRVLDDFRRATDAMVGGKCQMPRGNTYYRRA